jgi:glycosyltransferase involved in cell wall biosynthesis
VILAQDYCSGKFDILYLYAKLMGIPLMAYHTGSTINGYSGKFLRQFTIRRASWIYASGEKELKRLEKDYNISSGCLNIIRPPIDVKIYKRIQREEACGEGGLKSERRYWIFVGRLDDVVKRVSAIIKTFCEAVETLPNLDLLIVGMGNDEKKIKGLVPEKFRNRILFLGWIADDHKKAVLYNCSECLLMASSREGFPTVIGEAFACGIPVICSDVGTIADLVIHGKTGWLFPPGDDKAMLQIFQSVAHYPEQLNALRSSLRLLAEENVSFEVTALALKKGFACVTAEKK